jgi:hypothetical protein
MLLSEWTAANKGTSLTEPSAGDDGPQKAADEDQTEDPEEEQPPEDDRDVD